MNKQYTLQEMMAADGFEYIRPLMSQGYFINKKGLITRNDTGGIHTTPWIMHNTHLTGNNCAKWHELIFNTFNVIPIKCFDCYKVVVRPRTVSELMKLSEIQAGMGVACKAGIETRAYTPALYGGYFYCRGLEEGQKRYKQVRKVMDKHFGEDMVVYLKRACTEYEMAFGESDKWQPSPMAEFYEAWIDKYVDPKVFGTDHNFTSFTKLGTKISWIKFAFEHGDETYKEFTDGEDMYSKPITYHEGLDV